MCVVIIVTAFRWNSQGSVSSKTSLQSVVFIYGYDSLMLSPNIRASYANVLGPKLCSGLRDLERWEPDSKG